MSLADTLTLRVTLRSRHYHASRLHRSKLYLSVLLLMIANCQSASLLVTVKPFLFPTSYQGLVSKYPQQPSRRRYDVSRRKPESSCLWSLLRLRSALLLLWESSHLCEQQSRNHDISNEIIKQRGFPVHRRGVRIECW